MADANARLPFGRFFSQVFLKEHTHPINVVLHVLGTASSIVLVVYVIAQRRPLALLLWPVLNIVPGLIGHRLFERNSDVGDMRFMRTDYPGMWFLLGNHVMLWELVTKGFYWGSK